MAITKLSSDHYAMYGPIISLKIPDDSVRPYMHLMIGDLGLPVVDAYEAPIVMAADGLPYMTAEGTVCYYHTPTVNGWEQSSILNKDPEVPVYYENFDVSRILWSNFDILDSSGAVLVPATNPMPLGFATIVEWDGVVDDGVTEVINDKTYIRIDDYQDASVCMLQVLGSTASKLLVRSVEDGWEAIYGSDLAVYGKIDNGIYVDTSCSKVLVAYYLGASDVSDKHLVLKLIAIGDAIRGKTDIVSTITLDQMVEAINGIEGPALTATSTTFSKSGNTITETSTLEDGTTAKSTINLDYSGNVTSVVGDDDMTIAITRDADGNATSMSIDGVDHPITWEGF